jgi:adenylate cyclase
MQRFPLAAPDLLAAAAIGLAAFAAAVLLRGAGALERVDLAFDDVLLNATRPAAAAEGFFIILEREDDLAKWGFPLSDDTLAALLEKVSAAGPLAIGIDKYRDRPVPPGTERLAATLAKSDRIYWVAKFGTDPREAVDAPATLDKRFVGCGDLMDDRDGAVRRALVYLDHGDHVCYSLGFQLARHVARAKGENWSFTTDEPPKLVAGAARMRPVDPGDGPYALIDAAGFQVAIPTAAGMPKFDTASFDDVMQGKVDLQRMRGRVVLFGSEAASLRDFFAIPSSHGTEGLRTVAGVQMHALIAAHLLDVARQRSDPLLLLPSIATLIATGALALLMAVIACSRRKTGRVLVFAATVMAFYVLAAFALAAGAILFAPAAAAVAMALALAAGIARHAWLESRERAQLMDIFSRHVSTEVADALWESRAALIAQGAFVPRPLVATVLFLDIRGFTTAFEQLTAEQSVPWLNRGLAAMTESIMRHQGVVARFIGDSIMAVFGAPVPRANDEQVAADARNAVRAALEMRSVLAGLNQEFSARSLPRMRIRVGINTGNMTQCSVGTDRRMEFTLLGDAVNTASRLESYAMEDDGQDVRILISERTMELAGAQFQARPVGSILLKGKEVPVKLFQVVGET